MFRKAIEESLTSHPKPATVSDRHVLVVRGSDGLYLCDDESSKGVYLDWRLFLLQRRELTKYIFVAQDQRLLQKSKASAMSCEAGL